jgi:hypothetical protein
MRNTRSDGPRMTLQTLLVLQAMLSDPTARHYGLELSRVAGFATGTVYPILARLEKADWVSSDWEDVDPAQEGRPRRRLYMLTGKGAEGARGALEKWHGRITVPPAKDVPAGRFPGLNGSPA